MQSVSKNYLCYVGQEEGYKTPIQKLFRDFYLIGLM